MKGKFQYDLCEYLLVVDLPNRINWEVEDIKQEFVAAYGDFKGAASIPYISVLNLILHKSQEKEVLNRLSERLSAMEGFDISLRDFGFFDSGNTVYINVNSGGSLETIHNFLLADLYVKRVLMSPANRNLKPYLTIGRKLTDSQFRNAYHDFKYRQYANFFRVSSLTLLKRKGPLANWSFFAEIPLKVEEGCVV